MTSRPLALALVVALAVFGGLVGLWAPTATAQSLVYELGGASLAAPPHFPVLLGDVDGDGRGDFALSVSAGTALDVVVFSGADGTELWSVAGGRVAAPAGDVDGDGRADVVLATDAGVVEVRGGATGALIHALASPTGSLSIAAGVGDVDADGFDDFAASDTTFGAFAGVVVVVSGQSGSPLQLHLGAFPGASLGVSIAPAGDVDQDGRDDFLIGAPSPAALGAVDPGHAFLVSGADGSEIRRYDGLANGDGFGASVDSAGDVDADGVPDQVVGAPANSLNALFSGMARVFSGASGQPLITVFGVETFFGRLGGSVSGAGDLDRDGHDDVLIGERGASLPGTAVVGRVLALSGASGAELFSVYGEQSGERFGDGVDGGVDVDGDGVFDLVASSFALPRAAVHSGRRLPLAQAGHLVSVSQGGTADFRLEVGPAFAGDLHVLLGTTAGTSPGLPLGTFLLPLNPLSPYFRFTAGFPNSGPLPDGAGLLDAAGAATARFELPPGTSPALVGTRAHHAYFVLDLASLAVAAVSNAVPLTLVP